MTLALLQYILPLLSGYAIFMMLSGRLWPFSKPLHLPARPGWMLGLWFGSSVTLMMLLTFQMVNPLVTDEVKTALLPSGFLLSMILAPGLAIYFWYRQLLARDQQHALETTRSNADFSIDEIDHAALLAEPQFATAMADNEVTSPSDARYEFNGRLDIGASSPDTDATIDLSCLEQKSYPQVEPQDNPLDEQQTFDQAFEHEYYRLKSFMTTVSGNKTEHTPGTNEPTGKALLSSCAPKSAALPQAEATNRAGAFDRAFLASRSRALKSIEEEQLNGSLYAESAASVATPTGLLDQEALLPQARNATLVDEKLQGRESLLKAEIAIATRAQIEQKAAEAEAAIVEAREAAQRERSSRRETEVHLRVTRRALSRLESDSRQQENTQTDEMIELEQDLEAKIKLNAKAESALICERQLRSDAERKLISAKQSWLRARRDTRKNIAARAKVLATANKAIVMARHTIDARHQVERNVLKLQEQIKVHQATISSLIESLDQEKSKSREEVSFLSKQLIQKDIELEKQAIGGSLTSRLVKKVARSARSVS